MSFSAVPIPWIIPLHSCWCRHVEAMGTQGLWTLDQLACFFLSKKQIHVFSIRKVLFYYAEGYHIPNCSPQPIFPRLLKWGTYLSGRSDPAFNRGLWFQGQDPQGDSPATGQTQMASTQMCRVEHCSWSLL